MTKDAEGSLRVLFIANHTKQADSKDHPPILSLNPRSIQPRADQCFPLILQLQ